MPGMNGSPAPREGKLNPRGSPVGLGTAVRAGAIYFALVFAVGFVLGAVRVPFLVPRLGERWAELLEMPVMAVAIYFASGHIVRRYALWRHAASRLLAGGVALALLVTAELCLAVLIQDRSLAEYVASRDPVSGTVYLAMLALFGLAPWLLPSLHDPVTDAPGSEP